MRWCFLLFVIFFSCSSDDSSEKENDIVNYLKTVDGLWLLKSQLSAVCDNVNIQYEAREYIKFSITSSLYNVDADISFKSCDGAKVCKRFNIGGFAEKGDIIAQTENSLTWEAPFNNLGGGFSSETFRTIVTLSSNRNSLTIKRAGSQYPASQYILVSYNDYNGYIGNIPDCN